MKRIDQIDNLFEDHLSGMKVDPPKAAWEHISSSLDPVDLLFESQLADIQVPPPKIAWSNIVGNINGVTAGTSSRNRIIAWLALTTTVAATLFFIIYLKSCDIPVGNDTLVQTSEQVINPTSSPDKHAFSPVEIITYEPSENNNTPDNNSSAHTTNLNKSPINKADIEPYSTSVSEQINSFNTDPNTENELTIKTIQPENIPDRATEYVNDIDIVKLNTGTPIAEQTEETAKINIPDDRIKPVQSNQERNKEPVQEVAETNGSETGSNKAAPTKNTNPETQSKRQSASEVTSISENSDLDSASSLVAPNLNTGIKFATGFSIQIYGGPSYLLNSSPQTLSHLEGNYTKGMDENITDFNTGIGVRYHVNHLFIHTGLQFSSYGEKTSYSWQENFIEHLGYDSVANFVIEYSYSSNPIDFQILPTGDTAYIYESIGDTSILYTMHSNDSAYNIDHKQEAQNRYRFIEIPLMLGYRFNYKKLSFDISSGVGLAIPRGANGYYLANGTLQPIDDNLQPYEKTVINFLLGAGVHYHLTRYSAISVLPMYRTNLTRFHSTVYEQPFNYHSFTINFGFSHTF